MPIKHNNIKKTFLIRLYNNYFSKAKWIGDAEKGRAYCDKCLRFIMQGEIKRKKKNNKIIAIATCKFCGSRAKKSNNYDNNRD